MTVDYQLPYSSIYSNNHTLTVFPTDYFQTNAETNPPKLKTPLIMGNICLCHLPRSDLLRTEILSLLLAYFPFFSLSSNKYQTCIMDQRISQTFSFSPTCQCHTGKIHQEHNCN